MLADAGEALDPLGDVERAVKNRAKVGSARPSSLLYTYGPGAIMDLPGFSVMPAGLDDWEPIWRRREHIPTIVEPRLLNVVRLHLGPQVDALRPFPWQPKRARSPKRAPTSASRRGCSRSGSDAPAVTTSARCRGSATPTPTRSAPTWRSSPTGAAPAAGGREPPARAASAKARRFPPSTC